MGDILNHEVFHNRVADYLILVAILLLGSIILHIAKFFIFKCLYKWTNRTSNEIDNFLIKSIEKKLFPLLYLGLLYSSLQGLKISPLLNKTLTVFSLIIMTIIGVLFALEVIVYFMELFWIKKETDQSKRQVIKGIITILRITVWGLALIIFLDNLGVKISALVAGLGIGGVAVALASQAILGDMFSYFTIFFDRPFEVGDFIIVGDYLGTVEYIGVKTTRLRSLSGEQLIFSNTDLTNSRVRNYKRMEQRRVVFQIGVTYQTSLPTLKEIPNIIKEIITEINDVLFDRAHFAAYKDSSLIYEIVYYVIGSDYKKYMDIQQEINFQIKEEFEKRGIDFAYPTQTVYVTKTED